MMSPKEKQLHKLVSELTNSTWADEVVSDVMDINDIATRCALDKGPMNPRDIISQLYSQAKAKAINELAEEMKEGLGYEN